MHELANAGEPESGQFQLSLLTNCETELVEAINTTGSSRNSKRSFLRKLALKLTRSSIHPSTFIHPSAKIGLNVEIGANCFIDANAVIENHVKIRNNCYVGRGTKIDTRSSLQDFVVLAQNVSLGASCVLGDDFLAKDHKLKLVGKNSIFGDNCILLGKVIIGADCKVESFTTIGHQSVLTVVGDNVTMGVDVQARGWVPRGLLIPNCGAVFGDISENQVRFTVTSDWWLSSGIVSPENAAKEKSLSAGEWFARFQSECAEMLRGIEDSIKP